jgi:hypothetical protein
MFQYERAYCYARPTHEYLGFSAGLDFETKLLVKEDAPALLQQALASPHWTPCVVAMSGVTDPSAGGAPLATEPPLSGGVRGISQSGGDYHQEPPGDP